MISVFGCNYDMRVLQCNMYSIEMIASEVEVLITKDQFMDKYNISQELFRSVGIQWEELCYIYEDFTNKIDTKYKPILKQFTEDYLEDKENVNIHSFRSRVKDPEHLLEKIIRKKQENFIKYEKLDKSNYEKFVTDLIGIRCFVLFKADWEQFHNFILSQFEDNVQYYVKDPILNFDADEKHCYIAEKPKVHIRNGDARELYENILSPDSVIDDKIYRSVHYIIKYGGVYLEVQVRTLFEEGWGEVDHAVVYPYYQNDPILKEYTGLLNRVSGLADEMSSFFYRLKKLEVAYIQNQEKKTDNSDRVSGEEIPKKTAHKTVKTEHMGTIEGCLRAVLEE